MRSPKELQQIELLARVDELVNRVQGWCDSSGDWAPFQSCQALLRRVLDRVETLRVRLESPLVVATFGGTGSGKSSLVNALVGEEATTSGRERPTTRTPVLIAHPRTELELLGLPLDELQVVRRDADLLRDIILIDCPDPDTSETDAAGTNLARLRSLLPHCDVLIYVSTQQKYRSARVVDELSEAATGCRLVFVQTHADRDTDIRDDWRRVLRAKYEVPELFFVDSPRALREQQSGLRPTGEMGRLIDFLMTQLSSGERVRVRRANVLDLLQASLHRCRQIISERLPQVDQLDVALDEQRLSLSGKMAARLKTELLSGRNLWERRLLTAVTDSWGFSPFSSMLRLYNGLGALIASMTLYRARNTAQLALIGAIQGTQWLKGLREEKSADESLDRVSLLGLDDSLLREAELVVEGHVYAAGFPRDHLRSRSLTDLRRQASRVEGEFLVDARGRIDAIIQQLALSNSRWWIRGWYELLFLAYLLFIFYRAGRNFFYDAVLRDVPLLTTDFYIPAGIFFVLWSGLLVMLFTRRLRNGLGQQVDSLASELVDLRLADGLFPELEAACRQVRQRAVEIDSLTTLVDSLSRDFAHSPQLGAARAPESPRQPLVTGQIEKP
ncbi:MAG: dynamin family protein [Planctomycetaceae bacterium]